jgi:cytosine deaminase
MSTPSGDDSSPVSLRLAGAHVVEGSTVDVDVDAATGRIVSVTPAGTTAVPDGAAVEPLNGYLLLPAPAEPHAHLDKALVGERIVNATGDLLGAIQCYLEFRSTQSVDDIVERARQGALQYVARGATVVRTHVDVSPDIGTRGVTALAAVRRELADLVDLQIVSLIARPIDGGLSVARRLYEAAHDAGADLVGGAPHVDDDIVASTRVCTDMARALGVGIDLHTDETLDETKLGLLDLIDEVDRQPFAGPVAASHCVSLGMQDADVQAKVAAYAADAGVAVIANPQTNLFLQGRGYGVATPRGLTALRPLLDAGAVVAAGGDNVRDPFNPLGRGDPLEAASLLVTVGHLTVSEAWAAVSSGARAAMGLPRVAVEAGCPAELLAIRAGSLTDALATCTEARVVVHRGRVVCRTAVERCFADVAAMSGPQHEGVSSRS